MASIHGAIPAYSGVSGPDYSPIANQSAPGDTGIALHMEEVSHEVETSPVVRDLLEGYLEAGRVGNVQAQAQALKTLKEDHSLNKLDISNALKLDDPQNKTLKENFDSLYKQVFNIKSKRGHLLNQAVLVNIIGTALLVGLAIGLCVATGPAAPAFAVCLIGILIAAALPAAQGGYNLFALCAKSSSEQEMHNGNTTSLRQYHNRASTIENELNTHPDSAEKSKMIMELNQLRKQIQDLEKQNCLAAEEAAGGGNENQQAKFVEKRQNDIEGLHDKFDRLEDELRSLDETTGQQDQPSTSSPTGQPATSSPTVSPARAAAADKVDCFIGLTDDSDEMVSDFKHLKSAIHNQMDEKEYKSFLKTFRNVDSLVERLAVEPRNYSDANNVSLFDFSKQVIEPANGNKTERKRLFNEWKDNIDDRIPRVASSSSARASESVNERDVIDNDYSHLGLD